MAWFALASDLCLTQAWLQPFPGIPACSSDQHQKSGGHNQVIVSHGNRSSLEMNGEDTQPSQPLPRYRNLLNLRTPTFMIAVVTGGPKPSVKTNRQAVIDTWFDEHAYMVTQEDVPTDRVIRLSEFAESGELPRKVQHMFSYIYANMIDDYDWFVKVRTLAWDAAGHAAYAKFPAPLLSATNIMIACDLLM